MTSLVLLRSSLPNAAVARSVVAGHRRHRVVARSARSSLRRRQLSSAPSSTVVSEVVVAGRRVIDVIGSRCRCCRQIRRQPRSSSPAVVIAMPRRIRPVRHVVEDAAVSLLPSCSPPAPIGRPASTRARPERQRRMAMR
ncbi:hypothetical protein OsI_29500 [Oryza sativa Indica Group]|uniref:Uncharacterized protein n=1 Tax=Oryza sativa subsp. indica TaxID=39946 RepID=B8BBL6_ORYSI|nr:hypothetical protein OsI_29500 [Oryza sativa Indica Group]